MNPVAWVRSLLGPVRVGAPAGNGSAIPNLPVHPNYSGNGNVRQ